MEMEHPTILVSEGPPSGGNPICFQGIFPGEGIGMDSAPTEREIARQTVETVGMLGVRCSSLLISSNSAPQLPPCHQLMSAHCVTRLL